VNSDRSIRFQGAAIVAGSFLIPFLAAPAFLRAQEGQRPVLTAQFIERDCADCHDDATRKAGLNLMGLDYRSGDGANLAIRVRVQDRLKAGETPPQKKSRPDPAELASFVTSTAATLTTAEQAIIERDGRAPCSVGSIAMSTKTPCASFCTCRGCKSEAACPVAGCRRCPRLLRAGAYRCPDALR
jgi:hypothetical protein